MTGATKYKTKWTLDDFDVMGWHDATVYAWFPPDRDGMNMLMLIDYIFEWINLGGTFNFVVAPATLRFLGAFDLKVNLSFSNISELSILDIDRVGTTPFPSGRGFDTHFRITLDHGEMTFRAAGFEQIIVDEPKRFDGQVSDYWPRILRQATGS
jgi:hypothetical protein